MSTESAKTYTPVEMIAKFTSFDTTSRDSNLPLMHFAKEYLESYGAHVELIHDETGQKANLLGRIGPDTEGGIILSGHSDTVPVDGQDWATNPFELAEKDGNLYGRGTVDMKGFLAICTALAPEFAAADLKEPVYFAMSYDEEVGCIGVESLIASILKLPHQPRACIVGEPSNMDVLIGHMGGYVYETTVTGRDAHSSQTEFGVSAIAAAGELIVYLNKLEEEMRERGDETGHFPGKYTTMNIGVINGGVASNIVPAECKFEWGYRHIPGSSKREIIRRFNTYAEEVVLPPMRKKADEANIETRSLIEFTGLAPQPDTIAEKLALKCRGHENSRTDFFGTEAGLFQEAGIPTVVCGPGHISQAHRPNEHTTVEQVDLCVDFLRALIKEIS